MILITKTSDQTRQRGHALSTCTMYVCMYVCSLKSYNCPSRLDSAVAPAADGSMHGGYISVIHSHPGTDYSRVVALV